MNEAQPTITVVVAVFNGAATLRRCLDSVLGQTYAAATQLIVMDGGSTDGTVEILQSYGPRIGCWESQPDRGIYHAWNKALERAVGDWVCFIGSDDYFWRPDVLALMAPHLSGAAPGVRLVYGRMAVVSKTGSLIRMEGVPWEEARRGFFATNTIPHPGLFHHRRLFEEHGGFDESFKIVGDYDLLLRELKTGSALFVPDVVTVGFQHGGVSNSPAAMGGMLQELGRLRRHHRLPAAAGLGRSKVFWKMRVTAGVVRLVGDGGFRFLADAFRRLRGRPTVWH